MSRVLLLETKLELSNTKVVQMLWQFNFFSMQHAQLSLMACFLGPHHTCPSVHCSFTNRWLNCHNLYYITPAFSLMLNYQHLHIKTTVCDATLLFIVFFLSQTNAPPPSHPPLSSSATSCSSTSTSVASKVRLSVTMD